VRTATDTYAITELVLVVSSVRSVPRPYNDDQLPLAGMYITAVRTVTESTTICMTMMRKV
jgi:hypothetical protein